MPKLELPDRLRTAGLRLLTDADRYRRIRTYVYGDDEEASRNGGIRWPKPVEEDASTSHIVLHRQPASEPHKRQRVWNVKFLEELPEELLWLIVGFLEPRHIASLPPVSKTMQASMYRRMAYLGIGPSPQAQAIIQAGHPVEVSLKFALIKRGEMADPNALRKFSYYGSPKSPNCHRRWPHPQP